MDWTTGLNWTTGLCVKDIITLQNLYLHVALWNQSSSFSGLGAGFLSSHVSIGNLDDHENGLCGRLGNLLYEHVQEVNNDMLYNWGLN